MSLNLRPKVKVMKHFELTWVPNSTKPEPVINWAGLGYPGFKGWEPCWPISTRLRRYCAKHFKEMFFAK